jgi:hypothetical protein
MTDHEFDKTDLLTYLTGGCGDERRRAIEAHLSSCAACREYCADFEAENHDFLTDHPFEETITLPQRRSAKATLLPFFGRQYYALAASLVLFVGAGYLYMVNRTGPEYRSKGEQVSLKAFVQNRQGGIEKRKDQVYYTGEKIQFLYSCEADNKFMLLGIDSTGAITTYYPASADSSWQLEPGRDLPLANSIVLDEYTGPELFVALFSKKALSVSEVNRLLTESFSVRHSLDSIDLKRSDVHIVKHLCRVLPGGR